MQTQVPLHDFVHALDKLIPNRPETPFGTPPTHESLRPRIAWCHANLSGPERTQLDSKCEEYRTRKVKQPPRTRHPTFRHTAWFAQVSATELDYALDALMPPHKKARSQQ